MFTKANKCVLTRGLAKFDWDNSHKLGNIDELKKVKGEEGSDIVLWEAQRFIRNCLIRISSTDSTAHLSDRSRKREKAVQGPLAPREHESC